MAIVHFELADGSIVDADTGSSFESVMTLARRAGVPGIAGECGGSMACATCHVHVAAGWIDIVGAATGEEAEVIAFTADPGPASRLGCQLWLRAALDGLHVRVAG